MENSYFVSFTVISQPMDIHSFAFIDYILEAKFSIKKIVLHFNLFQYISLIYCESKQEYFDIIIINYLNLEKFENWF